MGTARGANEGQEVGMRKKQPSNGGATRHVVRPVCKNCAIANEGQYVAVAVADVGCHLYAAVSVVCQRDMPPVRVGVYSSAAWHHLPPHPKEGIVKTKPHF